MYLSYYKLNKKPFQINTDPNFLWLGEKHKEALSLFTYGVSSDKGFLLLTGDVGTGKTTLINAFVNSLGDQVIVARISDPGLPRLGFLKYIAEKFKLETGFETKNDFLILFNEFLLQAYTDNKQVLLIIDEAQHLTDKTLEEIRLLSNIEKQDKKLLNIFLVGQNEFNDTLQKKKNRALRQRLAINYTLYPFEPEETRACIEFRLAVAGATKEIFTPEAIAAVHTISKGFPRAVNIICDHALLLGYQQEQEKISEKIVHQSSKNLHAHLPQSHQHKNVSDPADYWLEDSELAPLSIEALGRVSQPLPNLTLGTKKESERKTRRYRRVLLLFIAVLILSGFFGVKNGTLDSISQFVVNKYKETLASTVEKGRTVSSPILSTQNTETSQPSEVTAEIKTTTLSPVTILQTQHKKVGQEADSDQTAGSTVEATQVKIKEPEIIQQKPELAIGQNTTEAPQELVEKTQKDTDKTTEATPGQEMGLPANLGKEKPEDRTREPLSVAAPEAELAVDLPASRGPETKTTITSTEELLPDEEKLRTTKAETADQKPAVLQTTIEVKNNVLQKQIPRPLPPAESTAQERKEPLITKEITPEPKAPAATPVKVKSEKEDDPGAVIDWLLDSKKTQ